MAYIPRQLAGNIEAALADTPVVAVDGARQVGKSTLVANLRFPGTWQTVTLDDLTTRQAAHLDPRAFVTRPVDLLVIDEAQLEPELFRAIKVEVDRDRRPGRFLVTGSSRLLAAPRMADSLVGRVEVVELWPFAQSELEAGRAPAVTFVDRLFDDPSTLVRPGSLALPDLVRRVLTGGFPEAVRRSGSRRRAWFESFVTTVAQSSIAEMSRIDGLGEIPRLLRLCAARTATELNVSAVASEIGLPARTVDGYLDLLARAFLVRLVPGWSTNLSSKVVRRPKLHLVDSGLAAHLTGAGETDVELGARFGPLLETFVAGELCKQAGWSDARPTVWHFRDRSGAEVDLVLEHPDGRIAGIEVKATSTPRLEDFRGLRFIEDRLGARFCFGVLLSAAPEATPFGSRLAALPVSALWT